MNIFRRKKKAQAKEETPAFEQREVLLEQPMSSKAIVVGAGHNGLICAAFLADAGYDVVLLEAGEEVGGLVNERVFAGEFFAPMGAQYVTGLSPKVMRDLKLSQHGLEIVAKNLSVVCVDGEGQRACFGRDVWKSETGTQGLSSSDVEAYGVFVDKLTRFGAVAALMADSQMPILEDSKTGDWRTWLQTLSGLPTEDVSEFIRWSLSSVGDILDETFESDLLKAAIAVDALNGSADGPRAPGTMANLLWHWGLRLQSKDAISFVRGGPAALASALQSAAEEKGVTVRTAARVEAILVGADGVEGVRLESGEPIAADIVVSSLGPKHTLLSLVGAPWLDTDHFESLGRLKEEGHVARLALALETLPEITGLEETDYGQRILITTGLEGVNRSSRAVKYDELPNEFVIELMFPSYLDPGLAPSGQHILTANIYFIPHTPRGGWPDVKEELADRILNAISYVVPNIRDLIIDGDLLTPPEIESVMGTPGGHWHHNDFTLESAGFLRTLSNVKHYHTPIEGLYLCGAGCHPGGGITGLPGLNASQQIIAFERAKMGNARG